MGRPERDDAASQKKGILYVVATPIGNLEDITLRAVRILREVDCIAAEDTRQTRKLLSHLGIHSKLISYFKHQEARKGLEILNRLANGEDLALVSDAGTPCVSDPGALLVKAARGHGYAVVPVPGPCALTTALSVSGIDSPFSFHGFLSAREQQRKKTLHSLCQRNEALVFYESPRRVAALLSSLAEVMGDRQVQLARELTKMHEELLCGTPEELLQTLASREVCKGEFVVIVEPPLRPEGDVATPDTVIIEFLEQLREVGTATMRDAVQIVSAQLNVPRSRVYQLGLSVWKK